MAIKTIINCDICGEETYNKKEEYGIIFTTEQTEGRGVKPYFIKQRIDVCDNCLQKLRERDVQIVGSGAQGYNRYELVRMELKKL